MSAPLRVLTCGAGAPWESHFVRAAGTLTPRVEVVRRCVDHGELLGIALRDRPDAVIISSAVPWLDIELVAALHGVGAVVLVVDDGSDRRWDAIGVDVILDAASAPQSIAAALHHLERGRPGDSADAPRDDTAMQRACSDDAPAGRLIAVWGATGSPGRTTVAVELALEATRSGIDTLLVDGDAHAASVAQMLGLEETPCVTHAAELVAGGRAESIADCVQRHPAGLRVLAGLPHPDLWPEVREHAWRALLDAARRDAALVVVDLAASIEEDEELAFDAVPYRRNLMTLVALEEADTIVLVSGADPVALRRSIVASRALEQARPRVVEKLTTVLNRVPRSARQLQACSGAISEWTGSPPRALLPCEPAFERVVWDGRPLARVAKKSPWLRELRVFAEELTS
jgi:MinD-like ATPase involved in chromosome partitioning or flagellar assembly